MRCLTRRVGLCLAMALCVIMVFPRSASSQELISNRSPYTLYDVAPRYLIDMPTAGTLPRGMYNIGVRLYQGGGGLMYTDIGLSNQFQIGISFGGQDVISNRTLDPNPRIGFNVKFQLIGERPAFPAIAVGYSDQGMGGYSDAFERYRFKSRGFYAVASVSRLIYDWTCGFHGGINYSLENEVDGEEVPNFFVGFDAIVYNHMAILFEYDFALNDDKSQFPEIAGRGRGYFNASIKWLFNESLEIELIARDLLVNRREAETFAREMRIVYTESF